MVKPADTPFAKPKPTSARDEALAAYRALGYNRPPQSKPTLRGRSVFGQVSLGLEGGRVGAPADHAW